MRKGTGNFSRGIFVRAALCICMLASGLTAYCPASSAAGVKAAFYGLPAPDALLSVSQTRSYPVLQGMKIDPDDPLKFEFIIDPNGAEKVSDEEVKRLAEYFLAVLAIPEDDLWVNLSPYEKERVITETLSYTELGKDLLGQDYVLKQLVASLTYPENEAGKKYWDEVYSQVRRITGTTKIPINTFNKVWIVPEKANVVENGNIALIEEASLKAMHEEDFLALDNNAAQIQKETKLAGDKTVRDVNQVSSRVFKQMLLPVIEKEINQGENFARLRQAYNSFILASWFKKKLQNSVYKNFISQGKIDGIDLNDKQAKVKIFNLYAEAYKKGVYDYVKKEYEPGDHTYIKRRYCSGGITQLTSDKIKTRIGDISKQLKKTLRRKVVDLGFLPGRVKDTDEKNLKLMILIGRAITGKMAERHGNSFIRLLPNDEMIMVQAAHNLKTEHPDILLKDITYDWLVGNNILADEGWLNRPDRSYDGGGISEKGESETLFTMTKSGDYENVLSLEKKVNNYFLTWERRMLGRDESIDKLSIQFENLKKAILAYEYAEQNIYSLEYDRPDSRKKSIEKMLADSTEKQRADLFTFEIEKPLAYGEKTFILTIKQKDEGDNFILTFRSTYYLTGTRSDKLLAEKEYDNPEIALKVLTSLKENIWSIADVSNPIEYAESQLASKDGGKPVTLLKMTETLSLSEDGETIRLSLEKTKNSYNLAWEKRNGPQQKSVTNSKSKIKFTSLKQALLAFEYASDDVAELDQKSRGDREKTIKEAVEQLSNRGTLLYKFTLRRYGQDPNYILSIDEFMREENPFEVTIKSESDGTSLAVSRHETAENALEVLDCLLDNRFALRSNTVPEIIMEYVLTSIDTKRRGEDGDGNKVAADRAKALVLALQGKVTVRVSAELPSYKPSPGSLKVSPYARRGALDFWQTEKKAREEAEEVVKTKIRELFSPDTTDAYEYKMQLSDIVAAVMEWVHLEEIKSELVGSPQNDSAGHLYEFRLELNNKDGGGDQEILSAEKIERIKEAMKLYFESNERVITDDEIESDLLGAIDKLIQHLAILRGKLEDSGKRYLEGECERDRATWEKIRAEVRTYQRVQHQQEILRAQRIERIKEAMKLYFESNERVITDDEIESDLLGAIDKLIQHLAILRGKLEDSGKRYLEGECERDRATWEKIRAEVRTYQNAQKDGGGDQEILSAEKIERIKEAMKLYFESNERVITDDEIESDLLGAVNKLVEYLKKERTQTLKDPESSLAAYRYSENDVDYWTEVLGKVEMNEKLKNDLLDAAKDRRVITLVTSNGERWEVRLWSQMDMNHLESDMKNGHLLAYPTKSSPLADEADGVYFFFAGKPGFEGNEFTQFIAEKRTERGFSYWEVTRRDEYSNYDGTKHLEVRDVVAINMNRDGGGDQKTPNTQRIAEIKEKVRKSYLFGLNPYDHDDTISESDLEYDLTGAIHKIIRYLERKSYTSGDIGPGRAFYTEHRYTDIEIANWEKMLGEVMIYQRAQDAIPGMNKGFTINPFGFGDSAYDGGGNPVGGIAFYNEDLIKADGDITFNWSPEVISQFENMRGLEIIAISEGGSVEDLLKKEEG